MGYLNAKKGIPLLAQCLAGAVRLDPRATLHIAGRMLDERFGVYFKHLIREMQLADHVVDHGWIDDIPGFLQDKDYIISTSPWEACPNNVIEAMACGIKPLVHNWPGARELFPEECVFSSIHDFEQILATGSYDSHRYRSWIEERFNADIQLPKLEAFLRQAANRPLPDVAKPTVSLCMIAGGQTEGAIAQLEQRLPAALESARPWVDEIVLIDTGCGPQVREQLDAFSERCRPDGPAVIVREHAWKGDFALHRNQSLSYATGEWVLILDADEELDQESAQLLGELDAVPAGTDAFYVVVANKVRDGHTMLMQARLFRRGAVRYEQRVHNVPQVEGRVERSSLTLIHHGYNESPEVMAAKQKRRLEMCEKWIEDEPESPIAWSYLARTRLALAETLPLAVEAAEKAFELHQANGGHPSLLPHLLYPLFGGCIAAGRDEDTLRYAQICADAHPLHPDPFYYASVVFARQGRWDEVFHTAGRFLELQARARVKPEMFVRFENMTFSRVEEALGLLGRAMVEREDAGR